jgi:hypothetical protein
MPFYIPISPLGFAKIKKEGMGKTIGEVHFC